MTAGSEGPFPAVATWRINAMRFLFLLMALVMGSVVWRQLLFESADWSWERGLAKSMLAALALLSLLGVRYPLQMLPLMLYEIAWKTVWIVFIALRAWLAGKWNADIEALFFDCVGIVVAYFIVPWRYVWARYIVQPMEPLRNQR
jgi:Na+/H+ antiporter NhaC